MIVMHTRKYIGVLVISGLLIAVSSKVLAVGELGSDADAATASTQGQFAVSLAKSLGHAGLEEKEAIKLLSSLSISPSVTPAQAQWQANQIVTPQFVAYIQASVQLMLKKVAEQSKISPPPTLDLMIFEVPPAPQRVFFPVAATESIEDSAPPAPMPPSTEMIQNLPTEENTIGGGMVSLKDEMVNLEASSNLTELIDQAVIKHLRKQDKVAVIVELKPILSAKTDVVVEDVIAKEQQAVLDTLSTDEFRLKHRYSSIYTFSGWISHEGVKKLSKNPSVLRVSLDAVSSTQN